MHPYFSFIYIVGVLYFPQSPKGAGAGNQDQDYYSHQMIGNINLMASYLRRSKDADAVGGRPKPNEGCKRHPKHRQSPGVCSLCLREKLLQLSAHSSSRSTTTYTVASSCSSSTSSLSSDYSSSEATSYSSPMHRYRFGTEGKGSSFSLLFFSTGKNILTKSRSVAFAPRMKSKEGDGHKKKKEGLLSKLLHPRSSNKRKKEAAGLVHSRTMREVLTSRVH